MCHKFGSHKQIAWYSLFRQTLVFAPHSHTYHSSHTCKMHLRQSHAGNKLPTSNLPIRPGVPERGVSNAEQLKIPVGLHLRCSRTDGGRSSVSHLRGEWIVFYLYLTYLVTLLPPYLPRVARPCVLPSCVSCVAVSGPDRRADRSAEPEGGVPYSVRVPYQAWIGHGLGCSTWMGMYVCRYTGDPFRRSEHVKYSTVLCTRHQCHLGPSTVSGVEEREPLIHCTFPGAVRCFFR